MTVRTTQEEKLTLDASDDKKNIIYHVSVTGLQLKSLWKAPAFMKFAHSSMIQAQSASGIIVAKGTYRSGIHHTLSVWKDKESMQAYLRSGAHKEAMKESKNIGSMVKVYGYDSDTIPTIDDALQLWSNHGRIVFQDKPNKHLTTNNNKKHPSSLGVSHLLFLVGCVVIVLAIIAFVNSHDNVAMIQ